MQNKLFFYVYLQQTAVSLEIDQKQHRIMNIELLGGTSSRLYKLVAPLVMSAAVLRQNNNYPYKTSVRHEWLVALEDDGKTVKGFFPIERRDGYAYINNYYVSAETEEELLDAFIDKALTLYAPTCPLVAVVHSHHIEIFQEKGSSIEREWKLSVKMKYMRNNGTVS